MGKELTLFKYQDEQVRTTIIDNEIWWVLTDVCNILELTNSREVASKLDSNDVISNDTIDSMGRTQPTNCVNESGLYQIIFQSRKPEARKFLLWVTKEVLPSIRKTGKYEIQKKEWTMLEYAEKQLELSKQLVQSEKDKIKLKDKIEKDTPKVEAWDDFLNTNMTISMSEVAKVLCNRYKTGRTRLFLFLRDTQILMTGGNKHNVPYQKYIDCGYFKLRENKIMNSDGWVIYKPQTLVTPKGFEFIDKLLTKNRAIEDTENIVKFEKIS